MINKETDIIKTAADYVIEDFNRWADTVTDKRDKVKVDAVRNPKVGDYWHEMGCPYFLVVAVDGNNIAILNRKDEISVVTKSNLIASVTYSSIKGFVADVSRRGNITQTENDYYLSLKKEGKVNKYEPRPIAREISDGLVIFNSAEAILKYVAAKQITIKTPKYLENIPVGAFVKHDLTIHKFFKPEDVLSVKILEKFAKSCEHIQDDRSLSILTF